MVKNYQTTNLGSATLTRVAIAKPSLYSFSIDGNQQELEKYCPKCRDDFTHSTKTISKIYDIATNIVLFVLEEAEKESRIDFGKLPKPLIGLLLDTIIKLIHENTLLVFSTMDFKKTIPLSEQIELKKQLESLELRLDEDGR